MIHDKSITNRDLFCSLGEWPLPLEVRRTPKNQGQGNRVTSVALAAEHFFAMQLAYVRGASVKKGVLFFRLFRIRGPKNCCTTVSRHVQGTTILLLVQSTTITAASASSSTRV